MSLNSSIFYVLMLAAGIALTVITMLRMYSGKISIPRWAKFLLSVAMIVMLVITLLSVLPTRTISVTTNQTIISPSASVNN